MASDERLRLFLRWLLCRRLTRSLPQHPRQDTLNWTPSIAGDFIEDSLGMTLLIKLELIEVPAFRNFLRNAGTQRAK
jgi:hypothetical protein